MENTLHFGSMFIIAALAFLLPLLVNRIKVIRIPVVIAEIAAGIIVGKSGFNLVANDVWIDFLSLFGFAYLMFLSGVEIDFSYFTKTEKRPDNHANPLVLGGIIFILTVIFSYLISLMLTGFGFIKNPLFLTLIFSTTSLGIVIPILKEKEILDQPVGQTILIAALIADFATMLMIPVVLFITRGTGGLDLFLPLIIFVCFAVVYFIGKRLLKIHPFKNPTYETSQLKVRAAFALVLVFVAIAEVVNVEIILGAFLAGILFSLLFDEFRMEIAPKLDAIGYGFLIPIFFIMLGVRLDLKTVFTLQSLLIFPVFILVAYAVKLIPSLILKFFFPWRQTLGAGFLLSSRLSLIIAISLIAWQSGIITETTHSTFILVAVVTCLFSPVMFLRIFPALEKKPEYIVIAGNHDLIISLVSKLANGKEKLIIAESNDKILHKLKELKIGCECWDKFTEETVKLRSDIKINTFVSAYDFSLKSMNAAELAKKLGIGNVIAVIDDPFLGHQLDKKGIKTVTPLKAMFTLLYGLTAFPESFEILYGPENNDNIDVIEIKIVSAGIVGVKLKRIKLPGDCLVLMVAREGKRIIPDGNTKLVKNDIIVMIGSKEYMHEAVGIFN